MSDPLEMPGRSGDDRAWSQLVAAVLLLLAWIGLLLTGFLVDSRDHTMAVKDAIQSSLPNYRPTAPPSAPEPILSTNVVVIFQLPGGANITNTVEVPRSVLAPALVRNRVPVNAGELLLSLIAVVFCWTWANLVWTAAVASLVGGILARPMQSFWPLFRREACWSVLNGLVVVLVLVFCDILFGESLEKSLRLRDVLDARPLLSGSYIKLAFFASLFGLALGMRPERISNLPQKIPLVAKFLS